MFFTLQSETAVFLYFKDLELHTIELKKFTNYSEELSDLVAKIKSSLDVWSAFLTRHDLLQADNLPEALDNPGLKKALAVLEVMNLTMMKDKPMKITSNGCEIKMEV